MRTFMVFSKVDQPRSRMADAKEKSLRFLSRHCQ